MIHIEAAGLSDLGRIREGNEDAYLIDEARQLYLVADGMGGHQAGEVASGLVVETFRRFLQNGGADPEPYDRMLSPDANRIAAWVRSANRAVYEKSLERAEYRGMGSTLAAVAYTDSTFIVANVGDSPVYLIRNRAIEPLSVTHTVAAELGATHPDRLRYLDPKVQHMLTRAIGVGPAVEPDICELQCFRGDIVVLCSDGLSNKVSPDELAAIAAAAPPAQACRTLVDLANERGGEDNITVIVLNVIKQNLPQNRLLRFVALLQQTIRGITARKQQ